MAALSGSSYTQKNLVIMSETLDDLLNELNYFVPNQAHLTFQAELGLGIP